MYIFNNINIVLLLSFLINTYQYLRVDALDNELLPVVLWHGMGKCTLFFISCNIT